MSAVSELSRAMKVSATLGLVPLAACGGGNSSAETDSAPQAAAGATCVASTGSLGAGATLRGRQGEYSLTMVGGAQGAEARSTQGGLVLHQQSAEMRVFQGSDGSAIPGVASPLFGTTDIQVQEVGALRIGSLSSGDPAAPGVLVIESQTAQGPSILVRLGSDANRRDLQLFDGGFTVLELGEINDDGFKGRWTSGAQGSRTSGYFCVERAAG